MLGTLQSRSPALIGFFLPIAEAILAGYVATLVVYMVLMLLVTRLGRKVLMSGDCVSSAYTLLLCLVWFASAAIGAFVCFGMSPLAPYGPITFPLLLAITSVVVVLRNARQLPGQQSFFATAGISLIILGATVGTLYVRHAFTF